MKALLALHGYLRLAFIAISVLISLAAYGASPPLYAPVTLAEARLWGDTTAVRGLSGIYVWPDEQAVVLLRPASSGLHAGMYEIINIESEQIYTAPGQQLGMLVPTSADTDYKITVYSDFDSHGNARKHSYSAKADMSKGIVSVRRKRLNVTFRPLSLIPGLGRLVYLRTDNAGTRLEHGLNRVYPPSTDKGTPSSYWPRYF